MKGSERGQFDSPDDAGSGGTLDAYLDGQLSGAELAAFEARLALDPALAGERDAQRLIDRSLRGMFVAPPFVALPMNGHPPAANGHPVNGHPVTPTAGAGGYGWAGIKAALLTKPGMLVMALLVASLLGVGGWLAYLKFFDRPLTFAEIYQREVRSAAGGATVDANDVESLASKSTGYVIRMNQQPAGVKLLGVTQAHVLTPRSFVLHARADGQDLVLVADRACEDTDLAAHGCGMHRFRREAGGVVFYELSPLDQPVLLDVYEVFPPGTVDFSTSTSKTTTKVPSTSTTNSAKTRPTAVH